MKTPAAMGVRPVAAAEVGAFTRAGAYMEFMEDRKGMLKEGYLADVVVLDADLEKTPASEVSAVRPIMTICDGRVTYER